jgi:alkanesulfonate monooxygenase SsuD/methylene tetrahydromethanopterin reductase-like flavin-dependent oxidoreductase (luciferase family)
MTRQRLIIGVSGASAPQLAWAVLGALRASQSVETHPVLSTEAEKTIEAEMGLTRDSFEALAKGNLWLTGSPDTVASRVTELYQQTGGFGYLLITAYDAAGELQAWQRSLRLLTDQVLPACRRACPGATLAHQETA